MPGLQFLAGEYPNEMDHQTFKNCGAAARKFAVDLPVVQ